MAEMSQGENPVGGTVCGGNGVVPKLYNFLWLLCFELEQSSLSDVSSLSAIYYRTKSKGPLKNSYLIMSFLC